MVCDKNYNALISIWQMPFYLNVLMLKVESFEKESTYFGIKLILKEAEAIN
jgi:hypothetical protein